MINLNAIPLDYEPRNKILPKFSLNLDVINGITLMSEFESGFLCGVIKKLRPKKILEVGVAAGGSTAIILQALEDIGEPYEMHSIDLRQIFFMEGFKDKACGFLATFALENNLINPNGFRGTHKLHLGKFLPQVIDEIGGDIDLVILDTVHSMPGEGLDFLAVLPYLTPNAVVVLHDVSENQHGVENYYQHATTVLFSAVTAEKFLNFQPESELFRYPNIAAFQINEQTAENIENVFLTMILRWTYMPSQEELLIYLRHYRRFYPVELCEIFQDSIDMNAYNFYMLQHK